MNNELPDYGLWWLVALNSALFIVFALSFFRPRSPRDWRSFGAFSAFLVALFTEMYGFPLTIYLLSGWLTAAFPGVDWFAHDSGHLLEVAFGWGGNPHIGPFHLLSSVFVFGGFVLLIAAWRVLYRAQRNQTVARTGPYALVRHPQYAAFISIMFGFLLQWPTLPTLVMFPILVFMYARLARREEQEVMDSLGEEYRGYSERTPPFLPTLRHAAGLAAVDPPLRRELAAAHLAALGQMGSTLRALDSSLIEDLEGSRIATGPKLKQRLKFDGEVMDMQLDMLKAQAGGDGEAPGTFIR